MKKFLLAVVVITVSMLIVSSAVLAVSLNPCAGQSGECLLASLNEEERIQFNDIIDDYQKEMNKLNLVMREMKDEDNHEAFLKAQEERYGLVIELHETLNKILPGHKTDQLHSYGQIGQSYQPGKRQR